MSALHSLLLIIITIAALDAAVLETGSVVLDLAPVANRGLVDPVCGDGKGGWTDQGPECDLRGIPTGLHRFGEVGMRILDGERSCVVLGPESRRLARTATLAVPADAGCHLYLLHALAWAPASGSPCRIAALDQDGGVLATIPMVSGQDVADWFTPFDLANGVVVLETTIKDTVAAGLYLSHLALPAGTRAIRCEATADAAWGIVAASVASRAQRLPEHAGPAPVAVAGRGWQEIAAEKDIEPGSAVDFSFLLDSPAGRHGFARSGTGGSLVFDDGKRARFAGGNLSLMSADLLTGLDDGQIARLAERWARLGNNLCRLLYIDGHLLTDDAGNGMGLRADRQAKLDLFAWELRRRGVYTAIDLMWSRVPRGVLARTFPAFYRTFQDNPEALRTFYIAAICFSPKLRDDWERAARLILGHVSPHTGLALAEDPQLVAIGLLNEDNLDRTFRRSPEIRALVTKRFASHLADRYGSDEGLARAWGRLRDGESLRDGRIELPTWAGPGTAREADLFRCLVAAQTEAWTDLAGRLRRLGVRQALSGSNFLCNGFAVAVRSVHDAVDNHGYWDHPQCPGRAWALPFDFHGRAILDVGRGWLTAPALELAATRQAGKPMLVTEYDHCFPNPSRSDAGIVAGAVAAFQDWDLFASFNYSWRKEDLFQPCIIRNFDKSCDPLAMAVERQQRLLFLRGDVGAARRAVRIRADRDRLASPPLTEEPALLAMMTGIGWSFADGGGFELAVADAAGAPSATLPLLSGRDGARAAWTARAQQALGIRPLEVAADGRRFVSDTGEIAWDFAGHRLSVDTPRTQALVATGGGGEAALGAVRIRLADGPACLSVSSLDGDGLASCRRALVIFASDVVNTGMLAWPGRRRVTDAGRLPLLVRAAHATLAIRTATLRRAWALDTAGRRLAEIPVRRSGEGIELDLSTVVAGHGSFFTELASE